MGRQQGALHACVLVQPALTPCLSARLLHAPALLLAAALPPCGLHRLLHRRSTGVLLLPTCPGTACLYCLYRRAPGKDVEDLQRYVLDLVESINARYRQPGYEPVVWLERPVPLYERIALYSIAGACVLLLGAWVWLLRVGQWGCGWWCWPGAARFSPLNERVALHTSEQGHTASVWCWLLRSREARGLEFACMWPDDQSVCAATACVMGVAALLSSQTCPAPWPLPHLPEQMWWW